MRKVVDLCKQSKKAQKAFYAAQRGSWNGVNPVSRVVPNGKAYSRAKAKADARRDAASGKIKVDTYKAGECLLFYIC